MDIEYNFATACYVLERDLGIEITPEYSASKFNVQLELWKEDMEARKREMNKKSKGGRFLTFR